MQKVFVLQFWKWPVPQCTTWLGYGLMRFLNFKSNAWRRCRTSAILTWCRCILTSLITGMRLATSLTFPRFIRRWNWSHCLHACIIRCLDFPVSLLNCLPWIPKSFHYWRHLGIIYERWLLVASTRSQSCCREGAVSVGWKSGASWGYASVLKVAIVCRFFKGLRNRTPNLTMLFLG